MVRRRARRNAPLAGPHRPSPAAAMQQSPHAITLSRRPPPERLAHRLFRLFDRECAGVVDAAQLLAQLSERLPQVDRSLKAALGHQLAALVRAGAGSFSLATPSAAVTVATPTATVAAGSLLNEAEFVDAVLQSCGFLPATPLPSASELVQLMAEYAREDLLLKLRTIETSGGAEENEGSDDALRWQLMQDLSHLASLSVLLNSPSPQDPTPSPPASPQSPLSVPLRAARAWSPSRPLTSSPTLPPAKQARVVPHLAETPDLPAPAAAAPQRPASASVFQRLRAQWRSGSGSAAAAASQSVRKTARSKRVVPSGSLRSV